MHSEFEDAYEDKERIRGVLFTTSISDLNLRPPILIDASATAVSAVAAMNEKHIGCLLVQKDGKLAGIFTERDVLKRVTFRDGSRTMTIDEVMTKSPQTLEATDTLAFALNTMSVGGYRHVPIVDRGGKPVGVLSVRDIVDFLVELFPQEVLNLPSGPDSGIPKSVDGG